MIQNLISMQPQGHLSEVFVKLTFCFPSLIFVVLLSLFSLPSFVIVIISPFLKNKNKKQFLLIIMIKIISNFNYYWHYNYNYTYVYVYKYVLHCRITECVKCINTQVIHIGKSIV